MNKNNAVLANLLDSANEVLRKNNKRKYHFNFWGMEFVTKAEPGTVSFYCWAESLADLLYSASEYLSKAEWKKQEEMIEAIKGGYIEGKCELAAAFDAVSRLREASTLLEVALYETEDQDAAKAEHTV
jgi:hypothetical protein